MATWSVYVNFAGYIGADEEYIVEADTPQEAEELALEEARDDLDIVDEPELLESDYDEDEDMEEFD